MCFHPTLFLTDLSDIQGVEDQVALHGNLQNRNEKSLLKTIYHDVFENKVIISNTYLIAHSLSRNKYIMYFK